MSSTSKLLSASSDIAKKARELCHEWLNNIDKHIAENINKLTCNDIKEIYYFSLFGELKRWRSSSGGFTGFSEFLVFRALYHTIGEIFNAEETGSIATDPIIFRSKNYEIGQSVKIKLDDENKSPDIYVKHNGKLISIIQVKLVTGGGGQQITQEVKTFEIFKRHHPDIRGFFIVFIKESFTNDKERRLRNAGYTTVILEDNETLISSILNKAI
jgi:hypothetical protein